MNPQQRVEETLRLFTTLTSTPGISHEISLVYWNFIAELGAVREPYMEAIAHILVKYTGAMHEAQQQGLDDEVSALRRAILTMTELIQFCANYREDIQQK